MLVRHKGTFIKGMFLAITFLGVLWLIFSPLFEGKTGLEFSDDLFNKLSKGSSYFIPKVAEKNQKFVGKTVSFTVKLPNAEQAEQAVKVLQVAGAKVEAKDDQLTVSGDLGKILSDVLKDSDAMYHNHGKEVSARYGFDEKDVMITWWTVLNGSVKELQKQKQIEEAKDVSEVMKKAIEPAFNYYGIEGQKVSEKAGTMTGLLVFYVVYTMWWGYAIFYLFDGIGLSMKKAKVKKEV